MGGEVISSSLGLLAGAGAGQARQGGGCNDAYSAFAFLSFLFALLTFIQNNGGRRKRRAAESECFLAGNVTGSREETSLLASAVMYQAFFNALPSSLERTRTARNILSVRRGKK